jgi:tetratricopeptide (TPR) repeat protein
MLLPGCAYFQAMGPDVPQKIDTLISNEEYGKALDILSYSDPSKSNYTELMEQQEQVVLLAERLERETLRETQQLVRDDEWSQASLLFEASLAKLPDSDKLHKQHQLFVESREGLLDHLELQLDLNRAHWLIANGPVQQEMIRVLPNAESKFAELKDFRVQKERTADHLLKFALVSLGQGDHRSAAAMVTLIDSLTVDNLDEELLVMCRYRLQEQQQEQQKKDDLHRQKLAQHQKKQQQLRQEKEGKQTKALIALLEKDTSLEMLQKGWAHLEIISCNKPYPLSFDPCRKLEQLCQQSIAHHSQLGRELYSQGKIHEALGLWQSLLLMDTNNQKIQDYVDRANRVLSKLQRLEEEAPQAEPSRMRGL